MKLFKYNAFVCLTAFILWCPCCSANNGKLWHLTHLPVEISFRQILDNISVNKDFVYDVIKNLSWCTFYKAYIFLFSRVSRLKPSCKIMDRCDASTTNYGRLHFVTTLTCVTLSGWQKSMLVWEFLKCLKCLKTCFFKKLLKASKTGKNLI